jgi:hypothetical protein
MPKIQQRAKFPEALRRHLIERMSDRSITLTDLNQLPSSALALRERLL